MRKKELMRKGLVALIASSMVLSGCGSNNNTSPTSSTKDTNTEKPENVSDDLDNTTPENDNKASETDSKVADNNSKVADTDVNTPEKDSEATENDAKVSEKEKNSSEDNANKSDMDNTTETQDAEPQSENTEEDIYDKNSPEMFMNDVKKLVKDDVGENELIIDVKFENKDLCVYVDISKSDTSILTLEDLAELRTSSITDDILTLKNYDDLWETITVDFGNVGKITNYKNDIETNAAGRYFQSDNFILE